MTTYNISTRNQAYVEGLVEYINDVKPYHCKLTEVVAEYWFFDTVNVGIAEDTQTQVFAGDCQLTSWVGSADKRPTWLDQSTFQRVYISDGSTTDYRLPVFTTPLHSADYNQHVFVGLASTTAEIPGLLNSVIRPSCGDQVVNVTRNGFKLQEGIDYHVSQGVFSAEVDDRQRWRRLDLKSATTTKWELSSSTGGYEPSVTSYPYYSGTYDGAGSIQFTLTKEVPGVQLVNLSAGPNVFYEDFTLTCTASGVNSQTGINFLYHQFTPASTWTVFHPFETDHLAFQVYTLADGVFKPTFPENLEFVSPSQVKVHFTSPVEGYLRLVGDTNTTSFFTIDQTVASDTWVINHNLGSNNVIVQTFIDDAGVINAILPQQVLLVNDNTAIITFSSPRTGFVIVLAETGIAGSVSSSFSNSTSVIQPLNGVDFPILAFYENTTGGQEQILPNDVVIGTDALFVTFSNQTSGSLTTIVNVEPSFPFSSTFSIVGSTTGLLGYVDVNGAFSSSFISLQLKGGFEPVPIGSTIKLEPVGDIFVAPNATSETWSVIKASPQNITRPSYVSTAAGYLNELRLVNEETPTQRWIITALDPTTFSVTGSVSGRTENAFVDVPYENGHISFIIGIYGSSFAPGTKFTVEVKNDPPKLVNFVAPNGVNDPNIIQLQLGTFAQPSSIWTLTKQTANSYNLIQRDATGAHMLHDFGDVFVGIWFIAPELRFKLPVDIYAPGESYTWQIQNTAGFVSNLPTSSPLQVQLVGSGGDLFDVDPYSQDFDGRPDPRQISQFIDLTITSSTRKGAWKLTYEGSDWQGYDPSNATLPPTPRGFDDRFDGDLFSVIELDTGDVYPLARVGELYDNPDLTLELHDPQGGWRFGDVIYLNTRFTRSGALAMPIFGVSVDSPFLRVLPEYCEASPPQVWRLTAINSTTFSVYGEVSGSFENATINELYVNGLVGFIIETSPGFEPRIGDYFEFEVTAHKPSYLVYGSESGWQEPATVGERYWNGKFGFFLEKPSYVAECLERHPIVITTEINAWEALTCNVSIDEVLKINVRHVGVGGFDTIGFSGQGFDGSSFSQTTINLAPPRSIFYADILAYIDPTQLTAGLDIDQYANEAGTAIQKPPVEVYLNMPIEPLEPTLPTIHTQAQLDRYVIDHAQWVIDHDTWAQAFTDWENTYSYWLNLSTVGYYDKPISQNTSLKAVLDSCNLTVINDVNHLSFTITNSLKQNGWGNETYGDIYDASAALAEHSLCELLHGGQLWFWSPTVRTVKYDDVYPQRLHLNTYGLDLNLTAPPRLSGESERLEVQAINNTSFRVQKATSGGIIAGELNQPYADIATLEHPLRDNSLVNFSVTGRSLAKNTSFGFEVKAHRMPLFYGHDLIIFTDPLVDTDVVKVDRVRTQLPRLRLDGSRTEHTELGQTSRVVYSGYSHGEFFTYSLTPGLDFSKLTLFVDDKSKAFTISGRTLTSNMKIPRGAKIELYHLGENFPELPILTQNGLADYVPLYFKADKPFPAKPIHVEAYTTNTNELVGTITQTGTGPTNISLDQAFVDKYLPLNSSFMLEQRQVDDYTGLTKAKITDTIRFAEYYRFFDDLIVLATEEHKLFDKSSGANYEETIYVSVRDDLPGSSYQNIGFGGSTWGDVGFNETPFNLDISPEDGIPDFDLVPGDLTSGLNAEAVTNIPARFISVSQADHSSVATRFVEDMVLDARVSNITDMSYDMMTYDLDPYSAANITNWIRVQLVAIDPVDTLNPPADVDGITLIDGMKVLLTNQVDPIENGPYTLNNGSLIRLTVFTNLLTYGSNVTLFIEQGTLASTVWYQSALPPTGQTIITVGTDPLSFIQIEGFTFNEVWHYERTVSLTGPKALPGSTHILGMPPSPLSGTSLLSTTIGKLNQNTMLWEPEIDRFSQPKNFHKVSITHSLTNTPNVLIFALNPTGLGAQLTEGIDYTLTISPKHVTIDLVVATGDFLNYGTLVIALV